MQPSRNNQSSHGAVNKESDNRQQIQSLISEISKQHSKSHPKSSLVNLLPRQTSVLNIEFQGTTPGLTTKVSKDENSSKISDALSIYEQIKSGKYSAVQSNQAVKNPQQDSSTSSVLFQNLTKNESIQKQLIKYNFSKNKTQFGASQGLGHLPAYSGKPAEFTQNKPFQPSNNILLQNLTALLAQKPSPAQSLVHESISHQNTNFAATDFGPHKNHLGNYSIFDKVFPETNQETQDLSKLIQNLKSKKNTTFGPHQMTSEVFKDGASSMEEFPLNHLLQQSKTPQMVNQPSEDDMIMSLLCQKNNKSEDANDYLLNQILEIYNNNGGNNQIKAPESVQPYNEDEIQQALQILNFKNNQSIQSQSSTVIELQAEIDKLTRQVQQYDHMKQQSLSIAAIQELLQKNDKTNQFSNDDMFQKKLSISPSITSQPVVAPLVVCPHTDKKTYAKNMCHSCYQNKGKTKMATTCGHTHKPHYSNGLCQSCYLAQYYLKRKAKNQAKKASQESQKSKSEEYPEELNPKRQKTEE